MLYFLSLLFLMFSNFCLPAEKLNINVSAVKSFLIAASMTEEKLDRRVLKNKEDKDACSRNKIRFLNKVSKYSCSHHSLKCGCGLYIVNPDRTKAALFNNCSTCLQSDEIAIKLVKNFPNPENALFIPPQDTGEIILNAAAFNASATHIAGVTDECIYVWNTTTKEQIMKRILSLESASLITLSDNGYYIAAEINYFDLEDKTTERFLLKRIDIIKISDPTIVYSIPLGKMFIQNMYMRDKTLVVEDNKHKKEFNLSGKKSIVNLNENQKEFLQKIYCYFYKQEDKKLILENKDYEVFLSLPKYLQNKISPHVFFIIDNYIDSLLNT